MFLSAYHGKDHFAADYDGNTDFKDGSNMGWGNTIVSARWNYIFNNRLFSNTTVSYNNYLFDVNTYTNNQFSTGAWSNHSQPLFLQLSFRYYRLELPD